MFRSRCMNVERRFWMNKFGPALASKFGWHEKEEGSTFVNSWGTIRQKIDRWRFSALRKKQKKKNTNRNMESQEAGGFNFENADRFLNYIFESRKLNWLFKTFFFFDKFQKSPINCQLLILVLMRLIYDFHKFFSNSKLQP